MSLFFTQNKFPILPKDLDTMDIEEMFIIYRSLLTQKEAEIKEYERLNNASTR